ncbi:hypothetical protein CVT26_014107 [Gymnopilus dilepis]|uniref:Uncharacterized protein n=1 Tax=Gymnopilus dilepis TaxID=231916 RepID=A0A409Y7T8_9AGAR|nr:hypothetical protein CVT26_014107 [Gymnopilus dilepis]
MREGESGINDAQPLILFRLLPVGPYTVSRSLTSVVFLLPAPLPLRVSPPLPPLLDPLLRPLVSTFTRGRQLVRNACDRETHSVTWQRPPPFRPTPLALSSLAEVAASLLVRPPPSTSSTTCPPGTLPIDGLIAVHPSCDLAVAAATRSLLMLGANASRRHGPRLPAPSRAHLHTPSPPLPLLVLLLIVDSGVDFTLPGAQCDVGFATAALSGLADSGFNNPGLCFMHPALPSLSGGEVMLF